MEPPPRDYTDVVPFPESVTLRPIARVISPFTERHGTPRQPGMIGPKEIGGVQARIELLDGIDPRALNDLDGFDHVWILAWLHLNGPGHRPLVRPPRGGPKRGLFSTRAPHRPNPLGLSAVRLLGISERTLVVEDLDLLDGTPILDIKPYVPDFDAFPQACRGWLDEVEHG